MACSGHRLPRASERRFASTQPMAIPAIAPGESFGEDDVDGEGVAPGAVAPVAVVGHVVTLIVAESELTVVTTCGVPRITQSAPSFGNLMMEGAI